MARHAATRDLLGAFALGAVDPEEAAVVRAHLATCAECQAEIATLWTAVDGLPELIEPMDPPPALRDRIAAAIMTETAAAPAHPVVTVAPSAAQRVPALSPVPPVSVPIRRPASFWSPATSWPAAPAIPLLLLGGLFAWIVRL